MKGIHAWLDRESDHKKIRLTKKAKTMLTNMALEAHKLDPTRSLATYYEMFLEQLRKNYSKETIEKFFRLGVIEV